MHGAGNDFVVLDLRDGAPPPDAALAAKLADRHFGVGCDQILTVETPRAEGSVAAYRIWNADGSDSQQCGNGARCIAAWLVRDGAAPASGDFRIDSPLATHPVRRLPNGDYAIEMGVPDFEPQRIPLAGFAHARDEYLLPVQGENLRIGAVSMGNPHAVLEVGSVDVAPVERVAVLVQQNPAFPQSTNVGFAEVIAHDRIRLRVHERGSGETLACGSGACAAAAVLMRRGRIGRDAVVSLPGGDLRIAWPDDASPVTMSGPATFVFEGIWTQ
ncbi:MAG: diaminopimelate epimerase [Pseudoxanthomonas sp.]